ncbi:MAG: hypothetical protein AB7T06_15355 [Kofleriaceae bacterium]
MPAIHSVLKRLGFVKLRDYGLVLTPEGRILSIRPAVLDDGLGGRIVGWKDDDLAAMELERWSELGRAMAAKPAALPAVAKPVAVRPLAPLPVAPPPVKPKAPPTPQKPVVVAPEPVVEEDDWEWTIAIARARAAAEEVEQAAAAVQPPRPLRADPIQRDSWESTQPLGEFDLSDNTSQIRTKQTVPSIATKPAFVKVDTIVEPPPPSIAPVAKTTPIAKVAAPIATAPSASRPAPIPPPLGIPTPVHPLPVVKPPVAPANRTFARGQSPATVIPIPKLPKVEPARILPVVARKTSPLVPVVAPPAAAPSVVPMPRRFAKGTGPMLPSNANTKVGDDTTPNLSVGDKTLPSLLLPASRSASR